MRHRVKASNPVFQGVESILGGVDICAVLKYEKESDMNRRKDIFQAVRTSGAKS